MRVRRLFPALLSLLIGVLLLTPGGARAAWTPNGIIVGNNFSDHRSIPDGSGGVIAATSWSGITAYRVDASGNGQWSRSVASGSVGRSWPVIAPDGAGGCYVAWQDARAFNQDIYLQRLDGAGNVLWTPNGIAVCVTAGDQTSPELAPDGAGGVVVAWQDKRAGATSDVYAQRVDASGVVSWTANGVPVCTAAGDQRALSIVSSGVGGAIVAWEDHRVAEYDIYAQRLSSAGTTMWTANGVAACAAAGFQTSPQAVADGADGVVMAWTDGRGTDIYVQRIDAAGSASWTLDGVGLCNAAAGQLWPAIASDGAGGAVVAWQDQRTGNFDLYARRVNAAGVPQWTADGVALCTAAGDQVRPSIAADGAGGAWVIWFDSRPGATGTYARGVTGAGAPRLPADGVRVGLSGSSTYPSSIVSDVSGGAIALWLQSSNLLYGQRLLNDGNPAYFLHLVATLTGVVDVAADQGGWVDLVVSAAAADIDPLLLPAVTGYNVWRRIPGSAANRASSADASLTAGRWAAGTILRGAEAQVAGFPEGSWESMGLHPAIQSAEYHFVAPTHDDSTASGSAEETFVVTVHTANPREYTVTAASTGHSVDNLPPASPANLAGGRNGPSSLDLVWTPNGERDFVRYAVYRGDSPAFVPSATNRLGWTTSPTWHDDAFDPSSSYYKVSALDRHGNESAFAALAPENVTGVPPGIPARSFVAPAAPNPFGASTALDFGLARAGHVTLRVFDLHGRLVRTLLDESRAAGVGRVTWNGRDDHGTALPAGVYLLRFAGGGVERTRTLVRIE